MENVMEVVLYVLPLIKYASGQLLGPERLIQESKGKARLEDVNIHMLCSPKEDILPNDEMPLGDHSKPNEAFTKIEKQMEEIIVRCTNTSYQLVKQCTLDFTEIDAVIDLLESSPLASKLEEFLPNTEPKWIGISILFAGQVIMSMLFARLVKKRFPNIKIIVGGAHITALQKKIEKDIRYNQYFDGFVFGYAEITFPELCEMSNPLEHTLVFPAGYVDTKRARGHLDILPPLLDNLDLYGIPRLSIAIQTTRGCAYGKCAFCTYPVVEGAYTTIELAMLDGVVETAKQQGAYITFKDSFLKPDRIKDIGKIINGRVEWAICTRLNTNFTKEDWRVLEDQGLRTVEIGVETISEEIQKKIRKKQNLTILYNLFENLKNTKIHLVLNVMAGFPEETLQNFDDLNNEIKRWANMYQDVNFSVEKNFFQAESGSDMVTKSPKYNITIYKEYPWTNICEWNQPQWVTEKKDWEGHVLKGDIS